MNRVLSLYKKEIHHLFDGILAYLCLCVFLLFVGGFSLFFQDILQQATTSLQPLFFWSAIGVLFLVPALSMASFSDENRTGSIEILMTLPLRNEDIVISKYMSIVSVVFLALFLTIPYPIAMSQFGVVDWGAVICGYIGLFLLGCSYAAIGVCCSVSTSQHTTAFLATFSICLLPFASGYALPQVDSSILPLVQYLSFDYHFSNLSRGILDSRDFVFYASIIGVFLHLCLFQLEQRRLRG